MLHVAQVAVAVALALAHVCPAPLTGEICVRPAARYIAGNLNCMRSTGTHTQRERGRQTQLHTRVQLPPAGSLLHAAAAAAAVNHVAPSALPAMSMSCRQPITRNMATTTGNSSPAIDPVEQMPSAVSTVQQTSRQLPHNNNKVNTNGSA